MRSDLVAESNRIEGYEWTSSQVRDIVLDDITFAYVTCLRTCFTGPPR